MGIHHKTKLDGFLVRRLEDGDIGEWMRMRQELWPQEMITDHLVEMNKIRRDATCQVFVAVRDGDELCGFLEAGQRKYADGCDTSPVGYIEGWFVDAGMRRAGVGKLLMQAAEEWARECGLQEMASDCLIDNTASLEAHLACGDEEAERLIHFRKAL